ncbi:MAG: DUF3987 domain-containing protein [Isosphaeraceae bacterium]
MSRTNLRVGSYDAWAFAALRAGRSLNGEVEQISEALRPFATRMAGQNAADRERTWQSLLDLLPEAEADALVEQVAAADPDVPPPTEGEPWSTLRLGEMPAVPDFPLDVLPDPVARFVEEAASAVGCDPGMVAGPLMATAGGLIGRSASLCLGNHHFAQACVFLANVGLPGDGKTPALEYAVDPVREIDRELAQEFAADKEVYRLDLEAYELARRVKGDTTPRPRPPVPRRANLDDATMEAVFRVLASNPRGSLMIRDELTSLILGMNQYKGGGGNDRPNLLKIWSGKSVLIDRVNNELGEPVRIPHPQLCVVGNLTPGMLPELVNRRGDDGLLDRWLFVHPDRRPKLKSSQRRQVSLDAVRCWREVAGMLWGRSLDEGNGPACPHVVYFDAPGKAEYDRLLDEHVEEVNAADFPEILRGPWSKLEEYAGRLCLILAMLRDASDPTADRSALPTAGARDARDAWRLVDYFKGHHRRVRACLEGRGTGGAPEGARLVLRWLTNHPDQVSFRESDLTRDLPRLCADRALLEDGLAWLATKVSVR